MDTFRLTLIFLGLAVLFVIYLLESARRRKQRDKRRQREQAPSLDGGPIPDGLDEDTPNLGLRIPQGERDDSPASSPIGAGVLGDGVIGRARPVTATLDGDKTSVPTPDADMSAAWQPPTAARPEHDNETPLFAADTEEPNPHPSPPAQVPTAAPADTMPLFDEADEVPEPPEGFSDLIIALQVSARNGGSFSGREIQDALRHCGLEYGEMQIYHYYTPRRRSLFYLANAIEPGSFDLTDMATLITPGIVFFLRLPAVINGLEAFDLMRELAGRVAERIGGELQDQQRHPLGRHELIAARERIAAYEYQLDAHRRQMASY